MACAPGTSIGERTSMGRFLAKTIDSLELLGCHVVILSAKELADAQQSSRLLRLLRRLRVPWLGLYWLSAFKAWKSTGYPIMVPISQEWVLPFGFSKQIPIYHDLIQYFCPRNMKSAFYYRYFLPWASRQLGSIYCVTNATGRLVRRICGNVIYRVCGVPIDKEFSSQADESSTTQCFQAVWVGTLMAHKNHGRVLDFVERTVEGAGVVAMVVPAAEAPALSSEIRARGLSSRITILFSLSDEVLSSIFRRSKTVLSTSAIEGFCMPVLEAALCGCAPVIPDRATFRENFGRFGVLVPPHERDYECYMLKAASHFARPEVIARARAFHDIISKRWSTSMSEIANAAALQGKGNIELGGHGSSWPAASRQPDNEDA